MYSFSTWNSNNILKENYPTNPLFLRIQSKNIHSLPDISLILLPARIPSLSFKLRHRLYFVNLNFSFFLLPFEWYESAETLTHLLAYITEPRLRPRKNPYSLHSTMSRSRLRQPSSLWEYVPVKFHHRCKMEISSIDRRNFRMDSASLKIEKWIEIVVFLWIVII